jgi:nitric oxide reductase large subunit
MTNGGRSYTRLWIAFGLVVILSFAVLGGFGFRIAALAPPIPDQVRTPDGERLFDGDLIREGQNVWQSLGGHEVGTIWGHGAYVAPDWSADYPSTANWSSSSTTGPATRAPRIMTPCPSRPRPRYRPASRK